MWTEVARLPVSARGRAPFSAPLIERTARVTFPRLVQDAYRAPALASLGGVLMMLGGSAGSGPSNQARCVGRGVPDPVKGARAAVAATSHADTLTCPPA